MQNTSNKSTHGKYVKQGGASAQTGTPTGKKIVIAVDGPAASGKSTLAQNIAERLGYAYLNTGALYRAVAFAVLEMGGNPSQVDDVLPALTIIQRNLTPELLTSAQLRTPEVSEAASRVAALTAVRQALLDYQRDFAKNPPGDVGGAVLDGRDIGTVICPTAEAKLFITASLEERARRRLVDTKTSGLTQAQVLDELQQRDQRDATRAAAPLSMAEDAHTIDTTTLDAEATLEEAIAFIRAKFIAATAAQA